MASSPLHVMCISVGEHGHMIPLLNVAEAVRKLGHKVTVSPPLMQAGDFVHLIEKVDCQCEPIDTGDDLETWLKRKAASSDVPFIAYLERMREPTKDLMQRIKPQVVVCDFATLAGQEAAHRLGLPLVINWPGPVSFPSFVLGLPTPGTYFQVGGLHFGLNSPDPIKFASFLNIKRVGEFLSAIERNTKNAKVLVHSFFGLETPCMLPPFIRMIGPVCPAAGDLEARFRRDSAELYRWLHTPGAAPVVVITTGSMIALLDWQVDALFHGIKRAGFRAVWGLKKPQQEFLPSQGDPDFWVESWIPQVELLNDDMVKVVVTHCGWGGTLECLRAGKPVVCLPFFGDQQKNAEIIRASGCGEVIGKPPKLVFKPINEWKKGAFTADSVAELVKKVMNTPSYTEAAKKMQVSALACGGVAEAAREIEWSARYGNSHLHSWDLDRLVGGSFFNGVCCAMGLAASAASYRSFGKPGLMAACFGLALSGIVLKISGSR